MIRKTIKRFVLSGIRDAGGFTLVGKSPWRSARLPILCYHGISLEDEHQWDPALYMSAEVFQGRLELLSTRGYRVIPLEEGIQRLYQGNLPPKSVVITFDDGNYDFYARALPLLRQYGFPATVYLTTFYCGIDRPVFPVFCSYVLWKAGPRAEAGATVFGLTRLDFNTAEGRTAVLTAINARAAEQGWDATDKDRIARDLAATVGLDYDSLARKRILQLMRPQEVQESAAANIDIQLHTHRHRTPAERALFQREIDDNRTHIRQITGKNGAHFCYPSGIYRPEFLPWLREAGVQSATTCETGLASRNSDPLLLPRIIDTSNLTPVEVEAWLSGVGALGRTGSI